MKHFSRHPAGPAAPWVRAALADRLPGVTPGREPGLLPRRRVPPEPELLDGFARLGKDVVDRRIVGEKADLELRRVLDELLHVLARRTDDGHPHRNVAQTDADVLLADWCRG